MSLNRTIWAIFFIFVAVVVLLWLASQMLMHTSHP